MALNVGDRLGRYDVTALRRCFEKDPRQRVQAIGDVRLAMEGAFETTVQATSVPTEGASAQLRVWQRPVAAALIVLVLAAITGIAVWGLKPQTLSRPLVRFAITPPAPELGISNAAPAPRSKASASVGPTPRCRENGSQRSRGCP